MVQPRQGIGDAEHEIAGRAWTLLHRLLDRADAFVSNLAPGATARLGISAADLAQRHPDVIPVEIDGYGPGGPISHKRAYDLLVQAESGSCAVTGYPGMPAKPGPAMADFTTGLYAAISILALLFGRGQAPATVPRRRRVELSLFDVMTDVMGYALTYTQHSGIDQQPLGVGSPAVAPYGAFPTRDGQTVVLGTTNDREWQRVAREIIDRPDLADDPRFAHQHRAAARTATSSTRPSDPGVPQHDLAEIQKIADAAGIGNSRYNLPSEVVVHPQLTARDRWRTVGTPEGRHPGAAAAAGDQRLRAADGRGAGAGRAHRRGARRIGSSTADELGAAAGRRRDRTGVLVSERCC